MEVLTSVAHVGFHVIGGAMMALAFQKRRGTTVVVVPSTNVPETLHAALSFMAI